MRLKAILGDLESPLVRAIRAAEAEATDVAQISDIDAALAPFEQNGG